MLGSQLSPSSVENRIVVLETSVPEATDRILGEKGNIIKLFKNK